MPDRPLKPKQKSLAARLLGILDQAYEAAENPDGFADLFVEADSFFFPRSVQDGLAADLGEAGIVSDLLDGHITRLQALIDRTELDGEAGARLSGGPQHASLVVSADGKRTMGNQTAARLLGCSFPCAIDGLGLEAASLEQMRKSLSEMREGQFTRSKIITVHHIDHTKPMLAKCVRLESRDPKGVVVQGMSVLINHLDWQDETLENAAHFIGLTPAETKLMACILDGMAYPEAAKKLSKSPETIKAQGKSILRKVGVSQMSDVIRLMLDYAYLAERTEVAPQSVAVAGVRHEPVDMVSAPDGRVIAVRRHGKNGGTPLLFFHGLYQGPHLPQKIDAHFARFGYEVFAPSRPGFGKTSAPKTWDDFNDTVTQDVLTVCDHYGLNRVDFIVHQAGISFACRAAGALGKRVQAAAMVGAGVPIKDYMLKTMNVEARVSGVAVKYAPKMLDMLLRLGIAKWRRQGAYAYLNNLFAADSPDRETLDDPENGPIMENGIYHMISQGPKTIMQDGLSAMTDWTQEYSMLPKRQVWLHGAHDPVMNPKFVEEFLAQQGQPPPIVYPDRGGDVLLGAADDVLEKIHKFLSA